MAKLRVLLNNIEPMAVEGPQDVDVSSLGFDSRGVVPGQMFFALRGVASDGHNFISPAIEKGAVVIVCEQMPEELVKDVTYVRVEDSSAAMGEISSAFYGFPSRKLKLVGITGTNGKTTTATLLYDMFRILGYKVGLISTVVYKINDINIDSTHTTPDSIRLNAMLAEMVERGCDYCFMEVSSHSVVQKRIEGLEFAGGVFSNITHDHLDYHGTFAEYIKAKRSFFDMLPKDSFALYNADDRNGSIMVQNSKAKVYSYSLRTLADFRCKIAEMHFDGMLLSIDDREVWVKFLGKFNAYNLLSVYASSLLLGAEKDEVLRGLSVLSSVSGRFEYVRSDKSVTAIIDYAHTPDALRNVIDTINEIRTPDQKLFVVVGCGGDRDVTKRPLMGGIAANGGDMAILTSDNPRSEDPAAIIEQMKAGVDIGKKYVAITDRREAIRTAAMFSAEGDIILVAGKGHETYQIINGEKSHFDDKEEILKAFESI